MDKTEIIETKTGKVRGYKDNGVEIFKGIPYAARPIGDLRFRPPVPKEPWPGILDAIEFGPECPQNIPPLLLEPPNPQSEPDCLTLNIWTPSTNGDKRPVMVWVHGGAFTVGGGRRYDGSHLVKRGNVVVVTINYRLGALGFSFIPGVTANVGMLDQIAALRWVHENIELFRGNPDNVTIFGQSAGGMSVSTLLAISDVKGLFHRVIAQSGACNPVGYRASAGKEVTERIMSESGVDKGDIDAFRKISAYEIVRISPEIWDDDVVRQETPWPITIPPYVDGETIPEHPLEMIRKGAATGVDVLVGTNLDESKLWNIFIPGFKEADEAEMQKRILDTLRSLGHGEAEAKRLIDAYKETKEGICSTSPQDIVDAFFTDLEFRIAAIRLAEAQSPHNPNTYMYLFTWPSPLMGGRFGSCHATEIPFVFGLLDDPSWNVWSGKGEEARILSEQIMDAWLAFAHTGNPNHDGIPEWPRYDTEKRGTMLLGKEVKAVDDPYGKERAAWIGII